MQLPRNIISLFTFTGIGIFIGLLLLFIIQLMLMPPPAAPCSSDIYIDSGLPPAAGVLILLLMIALAIYATVKLIYDKQE